jgi:GABA(A) receptor-associated protein
MSRFNEIHTLEERCTESKKIILKYPTRIPIIVEKCNRSKLKEIDKKKYLVPKDMTMGQFIYVIRKRIQLESSQALFVMVNNSLVSSNRLLGEIYEDRASKDGFLYIIYTSENTFG